MNFDWNHTWLYKWHTKRCFRKKAHRILSSSNSFELVIYRKIDDFNWQCFRKPSKCVEFINQFRGKFPRNELLIIIIYNHRIIWWMLHQQLPPTFAILYNFNWLWLTIKWILCEYFQSHFKLTSFQHFHFLDIHTYLPLKCSASYGSSMMGFNVFEFRMCINKYFRLHNWLKWKFSYEIQPVYTSIIPMRIDKVFLHSPPFSSYNVEQCHLPI